MLDRNVLKISDFKPPTAINPAKKLQTNIAFLVVKGASFRHSIKCEAQSGDLTSGELAARNIAHRNPQFGPLHIRLFFAYIGGVWNLPESRFRDFTVKCKGCGENIPAPVQTLPDTWIVANCPLCGERRSYLPPDIFRGRLSYRLSRKPVRSETGVRRWAK